MRYQTEARTFMVKKYHEFKSSNKVQKAWRLEYPKIKAPERATILNNVAKFEKNGSVYDLPPIQQKIDEKREEAKNHLIDLIEEMPRLSIRKASKATGMSYGSVQRMLKEDLHLKPYKEQEYHKLLPTDYKKRVQFAEWALSLQEEEIFFLIFSDEAYFYLTLPENKQNNRIWAESRPNEAVERPLNDEKVLVWCAISAKKIYGPYFFENSVNQHNYLDMLKTFFWPKHLRTAEYKKYYFQQDGATPHTANMVQDWLKGRFSERFINKNQWPPRSPDLNPCDFFLWGYLKSVVYNPLPKTIDDLKSNIEREIKNINKEILKSTFNNFLKRCNLIINEKGGHIENK